MDFFAMHRQPQPLLLANVWDAVSARAATETGYTALATSSAAMSAMLGCEDGEGLDPDTLLHWVARLRAVTHLPLTVDIEAGYGGSPEAVAAWLSRLAALGVVGVNLEDSVVHNGQRTLMETESFAQRLRAIRAALKVAGVRLFLNVRTDPYVLAMPAACLHAIQRGLRYAQHGADGLFVPGVTDEAEIAAIAEAVPLPLNVMCMPQLPAFGRLAQLGVKRISMGNCVHTALQQPLFELLRGIRQQQSFEGVFRHAGD